MCPPDHFEVLYEINPWMHSGVPVDRERAQEQWSELRSALESAGARVETIDPQPGLPDMVFTANAGIAVGRSFVPAAMANEERTGEARFFEDWFCARGWAVKRLTGDGRQEGAGDALPFAGRLVGGHGMRSRLAAYPELERLLGADVIALELSDSSWYHLDLAFCPLDKRSALIYPGAFAPAGQGRLMELVTRPVVLDREEAELFCANSVVIGRTVVMPACPARLRTELERLGFEVVVVDVSEFLKAGGGPRCLTLALDVPRTAFGVGQAVQLGRAA